ncbi:hypothetical protein ACFLTE_07020 [Bacteroidota bacterium]
MQRLVNSNNIFKKSLYILTFLFISLICKPQFSVQLGYSLSSISPRGFELFTESYNNYHKLELSNKLNPFNSASGINISSTYYFGKYGILILGLNHNASLNEVTFNNGNKRIFNNSLSYGEIEFGGGPKLNKLGIYSGIGIIYGIGTLDTYYKYSDEINHFGVEYFLNGKYKARYKAISLSLKSTYDINDFLSAFIKISGLHYFRPKAYHDKDKSKFFSSQQSDYLSTDYQHLNEINTRFSNIPDQYRMKSDIRGFRVIVGLEYYFNNE